MQLFLSFRVSTCFMWLQFDQNYGTFTTKANRGCKVRNKLHVISRKITKNYKETTLCRTMCQLEKCMLFAELRTILITGLLLLITSNLQERFYKQLLTRVSWSIFPKNVSVICVTSFDKHFSFIRYETLSKRQRSIRIGLFLIRFSSIKVCRMVGEKIYHGSLA